MRYTLFTQKQTAVSVLGKLGGVKKSKILRTSYVNVPSHNGPLAWSLRAEQMWEKKV